MKVKRFKSNFIDVLFFSQWIAVIIIAVYIYTNYQNNQQDQRPDFSVLQKKADMPSQLQVNLDASAARAANDPYNNLYLYYINTGIKASMGPYAAGVDLVKVP